MNNGRTKSIDCPESHPGGFESINQDTGIIPDRVGGYSIARLIGRGAMGCVYEARQLSLDRLVAIKTIRSHLIDNPASLARFMREAYAAAQLNHHNIVQVYDFGQDEGIYYFSMEYVRGGPLNRLVAQKGALDARIAAGYILQAARGLQFAHSHGMVHRDVKPANLLLSVDGVVKVADLGLVKVPGEIDVTGDLIGNDSVVSGTEVTAFGTFVGTPAYMAPEQGIDAATVDHRADIYSLGCTLYHLLAGKPPVDDATESEPARKSAGRSAVDIIELNPRVPETLRRIVMRMISPSVDARPKSLAEPICSLEAFLGLSTEGRFSPTTQQADRWEEITTQFSRDGKRFRLIPSMILAGLLFCGMLAVVLPVLSLALLLCIPVMAVVSIITCVSFSATETDSRRSPILDHARRYLTSVGWTDIAIAIVAAIMTALLLFFTAQIAGALLGAMFGVAIGAAFHFGVIRQAAIKQQSAIDAARRFVRDLRIAGADERGIRDFVARYSGSHWQNLFEQVFGYSALLTERERVAGDPSMGELSSLTVRDRMVDFFRQGADANERIRDQRRLAELEQQGLQSQGLSETEARARAWQMAAAVMDVAQLQRDDSDEIKLQGGKTVDQERQVKRARIKMMLADARSGVYSSAPNRQSAVQIALSAKVRFLAGVLLLTIFGFWLNQAGIITTEQINELSDAVSYEEFRVETDNVGAAIQESVATASKTEAKAEIFGRGTSGWSIGIAGALMMASSFIYGWRMTPFVMIGATVILFGATLGIPQLGPLSPWAIAAIAGAVITLPGIVVSERAD